MKNIFKFESKLEKFGVKVLDMLVENFSDSFFVGGLVRDMLLKKTVSDVDIATQAEPKQIVKILQSNGLKYSEAARDFGVLSAMEGECVVEIASFRSDVYRRNRYPKIRLVETAKEDSQRRDFTVNALYLAHKTGEILDFHNGLQDLQEKVLRFIGEAETRVEEDPLRLVRGARLMLDFGFSADEDFLKAAQKSFSKIKSFSQTRLEKEISKATGKNSQTKLGKIFSDEKTFDSFFSIS